MALNERRARIYGLSYTIQHFFDHLDKTLKNKRPFGLQEFCPLYKICTFIVVIVAFCQTSVHTDWMQCYPSGNRTWPNQSLYSKHSNPWKYLHLKFQFLNFRFRYLHTLMLSYESVAAAIIFMGGDIRGLANSESVIDMICEIRHFFMWAYSPDTGNISTLCHGRKHPCIG